MFGSSDQISIVRSSLRAAAKVRKSLASAAAIYVCRHAVSGRSGRSGRGGPSGAGAVVKAVNQLLCGVHIAVAAEALSLAARIGVDPAVALEILCGSAASSWMLKDRGPRMLRPDPEVTSAVDIFVKDLGIVLEAGRDAKTALPFAALAHQLFLAVSGAGGGTADDSQVIRAYQALAGPKS